MQKSSGSSISELPAFHYQAMICTPGVVKTPKPAQRPLSSYVEEQPFHYQAVTCNAGSNKTPRALPRPTTATPGEEDDKPSPFKLLEDNAKSLFPLVEHCELPSISADLLKSVLNGDRDFPKGRIVIIDTRHKFEYTGGHIKGAVNLSGPNCIEEFYAKNLERGKDMVVIFHCEFSSARAPKLFRHMRNFDRQRHMETYPALGFPYMYILHGGYKAFFDLQSNFCEPARYVRMADPLHSEDLWASNKILKRSWSARSQNSKNCRIRTQEDVLADVSNISKTTDVPIRSCSACLSFGQ